MHFLETLQMWASAHVFGIFIWLGLICLWLIGRINYKSEMRIDFGDSLSLKDAIERVEKCANIEGEIRPYLLFLRRFHREQTSLCLRMLAVAIIDRIDNSKNFWLSDDEMQKIDSVCSELGFRENNDSRYHKKFAECFRTEFLYRIGLFVGSEGYNAAVEKVGMGYTKDIGDGENHTKSAYLTLVFMNELVPQYRSPAFYAISCIAANENNKYSLIKFAKENKDSPITVRQWKQFLDHVLIKKGEIYENLFVHLRGEEGNYLNSTLEIPNLPDCIQQGLKKIA